MYELQVEGMRCGGCAGRVTKVIQAVDANAKVDVDLKAKSVRVATASDAKALALAVTQAGYPATVAA